ncbi:MAG: histidine triad nucleotide-binding protein [Oscillospiraceae bacterium]|nr:histidine triad nucleotide-binding protein [Oscillospiraceae bacterium]
MEDCIFCKIIRDELPSRKVFEDDNVLAFWDINPAAPVHIIVVTKSHIESVAAIDKSNSQLLSDIFEAIAVIAKDLKLEDGYRVISNVGKNAGQTINHLHFHLLGGKRLSLAMC